MSNVNAPSATFGPMLYLNTSVSVKDMKAIHAYCDALVARERAKWQRMLVQAAESANRQGINGWEVSASCGDNDWSLTAKHR